MSVALAGLLGVALGVLWRVLCWTPWGRCRCDRDLRPWLWPDHGRQALLVTWSLYLTAAVPVCIIMEAPAAITALFAALAALNWWVVKRHGDGKRRWPKRLAGRVRVDLDRRRLVVTQ